MGLRREGKLQTDGYISSDVACQAIQLARKINRAWKYECFDFQLGRLDISEG